MMSSQESENVQLGMEALDQVLVGFGQQPVSENPNFRVAEPVIGDLPIIVLEAPGAAPLRFVFGLHLDVWVGPFSEVVLLPVSKGTMALVRQQIEKILRSSVACQVGKRSAVITLQLPGVEPWLRLKIIGSGYAFAREVLYTPYF